MIVINEKEVKRMWQVTDLVCLSYQRLNDKGREQRKRKESITMPRFNLG